MEITINYHFIVGIDISKLNLDCYLLDRQTDCGILRSFPNNAEGFTGLGQWLIEQELTKADTVICSEHTGRYGERLLRWSTQYPWPHGVVKTTALDKVSGEHHRKSDWWPVFLIMGL